MHSTLFQGEDIALDVDFGNHPISIVTFEARNQNLKPNKTNAFGSGFGPGRFSPMGMNEFIVRRNRNHWYQSPEMIDVIEIVNRMAIGTKVITYGGSMGGFAAVNFAQMLNADLFIALSPLHDVSPGNRFNDERWKADWAHTRYEYNFIRSGACRSAKGYVFFAKNSPDKVHAEAIMESTASILVPLEYGAHPCSFFLNDTYKLKPLVEEIAKGTFDLGRFYRVLDERTPETHYPYWRQAMKLRAAGDVMGADAQTRIAISKKETATLRTLLGDLLLDQGQAGRAEKEHRRAIELKPQDATAHVRLSYAHAAQGDYGLAVSAMQAALKLAPHKSAFHARLGEWHIRNGELKAALKSMQSAAKLAPAAKTPQARIRAILKKIGGAQ